MTEYVAGAPFSERPVCHVPQNTVRSHSSTALGKTISMALLSVSSTATALYTFVPRTPSLPFWGKTQGSWSPDEYITSTWDPVVNSSANVSGSDPPETMVAMAWSGSRRYETRTLYPGPPTVPSSAGTCQPHIPSAPTHIHVVPPLPVPHSSTAAGLVAACVSGASTVPSGASRSMSTVDTPGRNHLIFTSDPGYSGVPVPGLVTRASTLPPSSSTSLTRTAPMV
mmetsp:Transcript_25371/g.86885  ORF Transcript_25371/g.86885 Transcript_25371/m.86885 type:complete len:225 (-) Transcript_25371:605-1279(-)